MMTPICHCCALDAATCGDASDVITWDGRIDNRDELLARLGDPPSGDDSDTALVLAAYDRWGVQGLGQIIGDWSVVIRDAPRRALVLARDFAGVRPLYYHAQPGKVTWSTRLDALAERTRISALDETFIAGFLACGGCPNRTPYAGLHPVPPGKAVCISDAGIRTLPFWTPPVGDVVRYRDERRYDEAFHALFREAVAVRLRANAPVIAELSGGLDSSSVVCMANRLLRSGAVAERPLTTVSYVHQGSLDVPFIREVEAFCGIEGVHISTHDTPLMSAVDAGTATPEGWTALRRSVAVLARQRRAGVLLTGLNGDLATGNWLDDSVQVAAPLRRGSLAQACGQAFAWSRSVGVPAAWILARGLLAALPPSCAALDPYAVDRFSTPIGPDTSIASQLMKQVGRGLPHGLFSDEWLHAPPERRKHFRALTVMRELQLLQRPDGLREVDYTHPFAHRPLVEFLMSVPADVLCRPGEPRRLMRRALAGLWPPKLAKRRSKSLFGGPWIEALRPPAMNLRRNPNWEVVERGWVDRASFSTRLEKLTQGLDCNAVQLRQIILLECWLQSRGRSGDATVAAFNGRQPGNSETEWRRQTWTTHSTSAN